MTTTRTRPTQGRRRLQQRTNGREAANHHLSLDFVLFFFVGGAEEEEEGRVVVCIYDAMRWALMDGLGWAGLRPGRRRANKNAVGCDANKQINASPDAEKSKSIFVLLLQASPLVVSVVDEFIHFHVFLFPNFPNKTKRGKKKAMHTRPVPHGCLAPAVEGGPARVRPCFLTPRCRTLPISRCRRCALALAPATEHTTVLSFRPPCF